MKELAMAETTLRKSHCNACARSTNHKVLYSKHVQGGQEISEREFVDWTDTYQLLECAGCGNVSMSHSHWFEPTDETTERLFPPVVARPRPQWLSKVPSEIRLILKQTYGALDAGSIALAAMGARAVLDMVLVERVGDVGTFDKKLAALEKAGLIGAKNRDVLAAALDAGSAAAHRGHEPSAAEIEAVMDILENVIQAIYHLEGLAARLRRATPPRKSG